MYQIREQATWEQATWGDGHMGRWPHGNRPHREMATWEQATWGDGRMGRWPHGNRPHGVMATWEQATGSWEGSRTDNLFPLPQPSDHCCYQNTDEAVRFHLVGPRGL